LYAEILAEECDADPALHRLRELEPSTATLVTLVREMVRHFKGIVAAPDQEEAQRMRLMLTSHLDDGEFARLIYEKAGSLIGPLFAASLERAIAAGDASPFNGNPLNLFWFAHHTLLVTTLTQLPSAPCLSYGDPADLERQLCEFILRGIGLSQTAISFCLDREMSPDSRPEVSAERA
jgi:TetR/AcrR family transcriptional regulator, transcriptional repressor of aconitase